MEIVNKIHNKVGNKDKVVKIMIFKNKVGSELTAGVINSENVVYMILSEVPLLVIRK